MSSRDYIPPSEAFKRLKVDVSRLGDFGFVKKVDRWEYSEGVAGGSLVCRFAIDKRGEVSESVSDAATGDEYVQHRITGASGKFVGKVRQDVMDLMGRIAKECFSRDVFKTAPARGILSFAEKRWGERPEFLWRQFPDYAVLRRKDTGKWYALVARLAADKIGNGRNDTIEIANLRRTEGMDGPRFLPAYHMNKKTWATIVLDGTIESGKLLRLVTASRDAAALNHRRPTGV